MYTFADFMHDITGIIVPVSIVIGVVVIFALYFKHVQTLEKIKRLDNAKDMENIDYTDKKQQ